MLASRTRNACAGSWNRPPGPSWADEDGEVVGFGRCVTDDTSNGYLSMVVVDPRHRRRGMGRALVAAMTGDDPQITWLLQAGREGSDRFWEGLGFRRFATAYKRVREQ